MIGYTKKIDVDVHDLDFNGVCRLSSLMRYIQSTAELQLADNGMSYDVLKDSKKAFILSKIKLEFYASVGAEETVNVQTFPCISRGYGFIRCYGIYRGEEVIGRAISVWALVDTENRSLIRVSDFDLKLETYDPWNMSIDRFRLPTTVAQVGKYKVAYSDIDRNRHVNNTKYPDIFANFLPMNRRMIDEITISYVNEAQFGDELDVYVDNADGVWYLRTVLPSGKVNAEAMLHLREL
ncbi:MAG: hypothetical protein E7617_07420 [Ruminococcaceae bacterium]|nr:hypothetical protein [Oscillospiraceae bacterium]